MRQVELKALRNSVTSPDAFQPSSEHPVPLVYHPLYSAPLPHGHRFRWRSSSSCASAWPIRDSRKSSNFISHCPARGAAGAGARAAIQAFARGELTPSQQRSWPAGHPTAGAARLAFGGGTLRTTQLALEHGMVPPGGGTHHAFPDYGSGFCIFNDIADRQRLAAARAGQQARGR